MLVGLIARLVVRLNSVYSIQSATVYQSLFTQWPWPIVKKTGSSLISIILCYQNAFSPLLGMVTNCLPPTV